MNAALRCAALAAVCVGMAACAPPPYAGGAYGGAGESEYHYNGSAYTSDGSYDTGYTNRGATGYSSGYGSGYYGNGYNVAPPPPRWTYDPGPTYYDPNSRTYYRDYYAPNAEAGWYDRWGRWHPSRAY
jgi:hypothetical protein